MPLIKLRNFWLKKVRKKKAYSGALTFEQVENVDFVDKPMTMFRNPTEGTSYGEQKQLEEIAKSGHNFVTCVHLTKIAGLFRSILVTWSKTLISHTLCITVENPPEDNPYTCKIDLKTWQFWGKKGLKSFKVDERRVDVYWDLRSAKFSTCPEPTSDYYVALVSEGEVVLLLGDQKKEAFKRTKSRPSLVDAVLVHKKENVFGKKFFCTRTMLGQGKKEHNIIIEFALSTYDPEIWISVDGRESTRLTNLHWRFRGNETIMVDDIPVHILWDVHDWLYSDENSGPGTFIFMQGTDEADLARHLEERTLDAEESGDNVLELSPEQPPTTELCHFLYAWKTE